MEARLAPPTLRALVIGYGNPLRGDDALGWRVGELLAAIPGIAADPTIRIETVHQLIPELAETIADAELIIFVDAAAPSSCSPPGSMKCEGIDRVAPSPEPLGHHLTPAQALAYAKALYGAHPVAFVATVSAASFDYGAPLSPPVEAALPSLVRWARAQLEAAPASAL